MEGVGARFGRSSTRYGATTSTVFTGPVRKWRKKWIHVAPNANNNTSTPSSNHSHKHKHQRDGTNGSSSHLLFYKWAPVKNGDGDVDSKDDVVEEPPKRKFRYVPVAILEEEQQNEAEEEAEDEVKPNHSKLDATEPTTINGVLDEKPDINDVPMEEENQDAAEARSTRQTVNLGFNLNSNEGDPESDTNPDEK